MDIIDRRKLDSLDLIATNERLIKIARAIIEGVDHEILTKNTYYDINLRYLLEKNDKLVAIAKRIEDNNATISQIYFSDVELNEAGLEETEGMTKRCRPLLVLFDNNNTPQTTWPYNDIYNAESWTEVQLTQAKSFEPNTLTYDPTKLLTGYAVFENRSPYQIWDMADASKTPQLFMTVFQDTMREEFENYTFPESKVKANLVNANLELKYIKQFVPPVVTNQTEQGQPNVAFGQYVIFKFKVLPGSVSYPYGEYRLSFFLREPPLPTDNDATLAMNQRAIYNFVLTKPLSVLRK
mgnify:CR=1 FL=1